MRTSREARHENARWSSCRVCLAALAVASAASVHSCEIPGYLLFGDNELEACHRGGQRRSEAHHRGGRHGSSALAGPDGPRSAYPARLEAVLQQRLPGSRSSVTTCCVRRQTAEDLANGWRNCFCDEKPDLVIWQTGTIDAIWRIEPDDFRAALDEGIETLQKGGADVILMNMQYSPRTDIMVALGPYADVDAGGRAAA